MDHANQLADGGEDGLLAALPRSEGAEVAVELAVLSSGGDVRRSIGHTSTAWAWRPDAIKRLKPPRP